MRKNKFTEEQIIKVLKEVEAGAEVQDVVRRLLSPTADGLVLQARDAQPLCSGMD